MRYVRRAALSAMIRETDNFRNVAWLGRPVWQNPLDAWLLQQTIIEDDVDFVIECGTNRGGSAYFIACIFDLLDRGRVVSMDVESLHELEHPRIDFLIGSSVDSTVLGEVEARVALHQPDRVMVMLDSDHSAAHVAQELSLYAKFVPVGGFLFVQDGCIDELPLLANDRPGPLVAIKEFVRLNPNFRVDERSDRYLLSHSPSGWLRRIQ